MKANNVDTDSWPEALTGQMEGVGSARALLVPAATALSRVHCALRCSLEHVVRLRTPTKMPAETAGGSSPPHVWTRTLQRSTADLGGWGPARHWTHASRDIRGNTGGLTHMMQHLSYIGVHAFTRGLLQYSFHVILL